MDDLVGLRQRFAADMVRGIDELSSQGYDATYFRRMLANHGPIEAVRRLVMASTPSSGLWRLQELHRLDLSAEMWVLLPWYEPLFAPGVREKAERKLRQLGVDVSAELARVIVRLSGTE